MSESCENCVFFRFSKCHRYPPTLFGTKDLWGKEFSVWYFPDVETTSWCGEYRSIEHPTVEVAK